MTRRQRFETWVRDKHPEIKPVWDEAAQNYVGNWSRDTWAAWNAALDEPAAPITLGIDWSTDYLTEQRAAMRDQAAELVEQARDGSRRSDTARAIRQLDPRPVLTQGSIDRAKAALSELPMGGAGTGNYGGAGTAGHGGASSIGGGSRIKLVGGGAMTNFSFGAGAGGVDGRNLGGAGGGSSMPPTPGAGWGASSALTPEYKAEQRQMNATHRAQLDAMAAEFPPPLQAKHTPILETPRGYDYIQAACSCGWKGIKRDPITQTGQYDAARDETARHIREVEQERRT